MAFLLILAGAAAHGVQLDPAVGEPGRRRGWREVEVRAAPTRPLSKEPLHRSERARYLALHLGSGAHSVVLGLLDESKGTGAGFDRLCLDANNNGDMTDDPPVPLTAQQTGRLTLIRGGPADVVVSYADGARRSLVVGLDLRGYAKGGRDGIEWRAACHLAQHMEGRVDFGEWKNLRVAIYDCSGDKAESNGCFDDYGSDHLRIDLDRDGQLDPDTEDFLLSRAVVVDGMLWNIQVDPSAKHFEVSPCALPTGVIRVAANYGGFDQPPVGFVEFVSDSGYAFKHLLGGGETLAAPEGEYRITGARLFSNDAAGAPWEARFSLARTLNVQRDAETVVAVGTPLRVAPVIEGEMSAGMGFCITARVTGAGDEEYRNIAPVKTRMKPRLDITDSDGIPMLNTKMEYG